MTNWLRTIFTRAPSIEERLKASQALVLARDARKHRDAGKKGWETRRAKA